jgi:hypothetical protein
MCAVIIRALAITLRTVTPLPLCEYYYPLWMFQMYWNNEPATVVGIENLNVPGFLEHSIRVKISRAVW